MKPGSLVQHWATEKIGVVMKEVFDPLCATTINKVFDVMWRDGTIGHNIWNYDLEILNENKTSPWAKTRSRGLG